MPENPKKKRESKEKSEEKFENGEKSLWSDDQRDKKYYYDDDHGYEIYCPIDVEEDDEKDELTKVINEIQ